MNPAQKLKALEAWLMEQIEESEGYLKIRGGNFDPIQKALELKRIDVLNVVHFELTGRWARER